MVNLSSMSHQQISDTVANDPDLTLDIANNMIQYGGSFVQALGQCFLRSDIINVRRLSDAFPDYILEYQPNKWNQGGEK